MVVIYRPTSTTFAFHVNNNENVLSSLLFQIANFGMVSVLFWLTSRHNAVLTFANFSVKLFHYVQKHLQRATKQIGLPVLSIKNEYIFYFTYVFGSDTWSIA